MQNEIKVSVLCLAYNHKKYIKKALESILSQKTNFKFEILIHDDASIDGTTEIIKQYEERFPYIIKGIYEDSNVYSTGKAIVEECMLPLAVGKYIAMCECDDFWTSEYKLQKQFEYMENNPNCSLCAHNTILHSVDGKLDDSTFNSWNKVHKMTSREVFLDWKIHTSSFFMKKADGYRPEFSRKYWFGDYVRVTEAYTCGDIIVLPDVMSQYNYGITSGALHDADYGKLSKKRQKILDRKEYLEQLDIATNGKFKKIILERILLTELEAATIKEREALACVNNDVECKQAAKRILKSDEFKRYIKYTNPANRIKKFIKYQGYRLLPRCLYHHKMK